MESIVLPVGKEAIEGDLNIAEGSTVRGRL